MLIAKLPVHAYVDGKRIVIPPGEPVAGLHPHDVAALIQSRAIEDTDATERARARDARAADAGLAQFLVAREGVRAAHESTQPLEPFGSEESQLERATGDAGGTQNPSNATSESAPQDVADAASNPGPQDTPQTAAGAPTKATSRTGRAKA